MLVLRHPQCRLVDRFCPRPSRTDVRNGRVGACLQSKSDSLLILCLASILTIFVCVPQFLPVLGRLIVERLEETLPPELVSRFAFEQHGPEDPSRLGFVHKVLDENNMYSV